ncbi:MAG: hypothetical protein MJE77_04885 [Proteobacteria bacterium]|nr:hypothetical protein [Pseudomonadota bacterium]
MAKNFIEADVRASYRFLSHSAHGCTELRAIRPGGGLVRIGYYDNEDDFVASCRSLNGRANIYVGIQPRPMSFLRRSRNALSTTAKGAKDTDIQWITALILDVDPVRAAHTASTDLELSKARERAQKIAHKVVSRGYRAPVLTMSGNGCHLWFAIPPRSVSASNREELTERLRLFESKVRERFSDESIAIDSIYNLSRIIKVIGTKSIKGRPTPSRPHRTSHSLSEFVRIDDPRLLRDILRISLNRPASVKVTDKAPAGTTRATELDPWLRCLMTTDYRIRGLFLGDGKTSESPHRTPIDTSSSGYDFSLATELIHVGVTDTARLASAIRHRPTGTAGQKSDSYLSRTIAKALDHVAKQQHPPQRSPEIQLYEKSMDTVLTELAALNLTAPPRMRLYRLHGNRIGALTDVDGVLRAVPMTRSALRAFLRRRVRWATMRDGSAVSVRPPKAVCAQLCAAPPASIQPLRLISPVPFVEPSGSIASEDLLDLREHVLYLGQNEDALPSAPPNGERAALDALLRSVAALVLDETSQVHMLGLLVALLRCLPSRRIIPAFLIESAQSPLVAHGAVRWLGQVLCTPNLGALYTVQETYRFGWRGTTPALFVTNATQLYSLDPVTLAVELDFTPHVLLSAGLNPDVPAPLAALVCRIQVGGTCPTLSVRECRVHFDGLVHLATRAYAGASSLSWHGLLRRISTITEIPWSRRSQPPTVDDVRNAEWANLFRAWWRYHGDAFVRVHEVNEVCRAHDLLRDIRGDGAIPSQQVRLGMAMVKRRNEVHDDWQLQCQIDSRTRRPRYRLITVKD